MQIVDQVDVLNPFNITQCRSSGWVYIISVTRLPCPLSRRFGLTLSVFSSYLCAKKIQIIATTTSMTLKTLCHYIYHNYMLPNMNYHEPHPSSNGMIIG